METTQAAPRPCVNGENGHRNGFVETIEVPRR